MQSQRLERLSHAQRERLAYIDFRLYFMGEIGRPDLASRFGVAPAEGFLSGVRALGSACSVGVGPRVW